MEGWIAGTVSPEGDAGGPFDRAALERHQLNRLRATLGLVRSRSAFYRRHFAGSDTEIATLDDLRRLPFTTADDIRGNPLGFVCVSQDEIGRVVTLASSGTTGAPKRLSFTPADQNLTVDFFRAGMSTFTGPGDRVLILLPGETPGSVGDLLAKGLRELGAAPIPHGPVRDPADTLRVAAEERASVIVGVPTHLLRLVRHAPDAAPLPHLHSVLLSTDHVPGAIVEAVERAWDCRVYNHYGMTEMGLGGGVDCEARRGYHVREADLLLEVVDPVGGGAIDDGETGEIAFTTLTRTGMPLIRYRTGDLGRWLSGPCPCGTTLRTLAHITTRVNGRVALGGGEILVQADLDEALFAVAGVLDFAASISTTGATTSLSTLAVRVQVAPHRGVAAALDDAAAAVRSIPAVARSMAAGRVASVDVTVGTESVSAPTLAKRSIAVERQPPG